MGMDETPLISHLQMILIKIPRIIRVLNKLKSKRHHLKEFLCQLVKDLVKVVSFQEAMFTKILRPILVSKIHRIKQWVLGSPI